jgi:hypothetical protein
MMLKIIQSRTRIWTRKNGKNFQKHENQRIRDNALILVRALDLSTRCAFEPAVLPSLYGADPGEQNFQTCKIGMH